MCVCDRTRELSSFVGHQIYCRSQERTRIRKIGLFMQKRPTSKEPNILVFDTTRQPFILYSRSQDTRHTQIRKIGLFMQKRPTSNGFFFKRSPTFWYVIESKSPMCSVVGFDVGLFCIKSPILRIRVRSCDRQYIYVCSCKSQDARHTQIRKIGLFMQKSPMCSVVSHKTRGAHEAEKWGSLCKRDLHSTALSQKSPIFSYLIKPEPCIFSCRSRVTRRTRGRKRALQHSKRAPQHRALFANET